MTRRYNLRARKQGVQWIRDDTLGKEEEESEDDTYVPSSEDEDDSMGDTTDSSGDEPIIRLPKGATVHLHLNISPMMSGMSAPMEEDDEDDPFIKHLMDTYVEPTKKRGRATTKDALEPVLNLNDDEEHYYEGLSKARKRDLNSKMKALSSLVTNGEVPYKFRVLELPIHDATKAAVIRKIDALAEMEDGEGFKLRNWVDQFLRIPFGVHIPLPVQMKDGADKCAAFLTKARHTMDKAVYGMLPAKAQVMQVLAQWIANPNSVGNVIALKGPMGVGKTSFARHGIAEVLERPFEFFSLGGASDAATFVGHSFTYEGSVCGRIVDALIQARCMNPVLYFDELDKISTTAHGEEIVSMLIHMTDRSQNSQFHDRYFAGVDFDLSQCLFVFSFNDESKIHPILRDRLQVITCSGYTADEKKVIVEKYVWPQLLERLAFKESDVTLAPEALKYMIEEDSKEEEGVRNLIRSAETLMTRINLLRIADEETRKTYKWGRTVSFPLTITPELVKHILNEPAPKKDETWRSMYN